MHMTYSYRAPEPGQLEDGECFAQPFYVIWGGDDQPIVPGVFDGVGIDAAAAYDDALLSIERHIGEGTEDAQPLMHTAYELAATPPKWFPVGGPFVCTLTFTP